jgi:cell wall assembly regulator SMI1
MRRVATSWKVIEGILKEGAPSTYTALRPPANADAIDELEAMIGTKLPRGLVSSLRIHDGMRPGVELFDWYSLLPVRSIIYACKVARDNPWDEEGDEYAAGRRIKNDIRWRQRWIPVMETAGGDHVVLDLDPGPDGKRGQLFRWYNNGATVMRVAAVSYPAFLDALAEELIGRRFTLDQWGSIQLSRSLV